MSGQYATKGFLLQAIVCLFDALDEKQNKWKSLKIEPEEISEKIDFIWVYENNYTEVVQVKSSINNFEKSQIKKIKNDLENSYNNADAYTLILIGNVKKEIIEEFNVGKFEIKTIVYSENILENAICNKLNIYFTKRKKNLSTTLLDVFKDYLIKNFIQLGTNGQQLLKNDLEKKIYNLVSEIEKHKEKNNLTIYQDNPDFEEKDIFKEFLINLGWDTHKKSCNCLNIDKHDLTYKLGNTHDFEYLFKEKSNLKTNQIDIVNIKKYFLDTNFVENEQKKLIKNEIIYLNESTECAISNNIYPFDEKENFEISQILFLETDDNLYENIENEFSNLIVNKSIIDSSKFYLVKKAQFDFINNSILHAKWFAKEYNLNVNIKFLYPQTKNNLNINKIKSRDFIFPPQYVNTSLLPIILETNEKTYLLLFCKDNYEKKHLRKIIWSMFAMTSGYATKYFIFFSDYNKDTQKGEVSQIIQNLEDNEFKNRIEVEKFKHYEKEVYYKNDIQTFEAIKNEKFDNEKQTFAYTAERIDNLIFGDRFQSVLNNIETLTASNLMGFLCQKGIYFKESNKLKITDFMSTLIFSPFEMEKLKNLIGDKEQTIKTYTHISNVNWLSKNNLSYEIKTKWKQINEKLSNSFKDIEFIENIEPIYISDNEVNIPYKIKKNKYIDIYETPFYPEGFLNIKVENSKYEIKYGKSANETSKINSDLKKAIDDVFTKEQIIKGKFIDIDFINFENNNTERINFLLNFTKLDRNSIFKKCRITELIYDFDNKNIPEELMKFKLVGTDILHQTGKNLEDFEYITKENYKKNVILEHITCEYTFDYAGLLDKKVIVIFNFSDALLNKNKKGIFQSSIKLGNFSELTNNKYKELEKLINDTIENLKKETYKKFEYFFLKSKTIE